MSDHRNSDKENLINLFKKFKSFFKISYLRPKIIVLFLFILISLNSGLLLKFLAFGSGFCLDDISELTEDNNLFLGLSVDKKTFLESPRLILINNSTLSISTPPTTFSSQVLGSLIVGQETAESKSVISEYLVKEKDTLSSLSTEFNISLSTLLWANNLNEKSIINPGQKLVILPVSGVIHIIKSGDSISKIAQTYQTKKEGIVSFNNLKSEDDIYIGDVLVVPQGIMPKQQTPTGPQVKTTPSTSNRFIAPVYSPYIITQRGHGYYDRSYGYTAVDFSHTGYACGKFVIASASGIVQKTGRDNIAGNYIKILHPNLNNIVTFYGHLSKIFVSAGDQVNVGEEIGLIGNTGYTIGVTGCHLHFEVRGGVNPFAY